MTSPEKLLPFLWAGKSDVGRALQKVKHLNTPYISASGSVYINTDGACRPANKFEVDPPTSGLNQSLPSFCALVIKYASQYLSHVHQLTQTHLSAPIKNEDDTSIAEEV